VRGGGGGGGGAPGRAAPRRGPPPRGLPYGGRPAVPSTVDALVKRNGTVIAPPFEMMAGRMSVVADPQGATFAVFKPKPM
ncbi:VOC family protein, partial [Streptomyces sp. NPDC127079]|uniref:VOC family protein n=1 Tax=Streptomyces sp. NPDC127079 TaxID=3347132 RepID=UPI00365DC460